jgi:predicted O-linked N-acetylglucosamine transferase (SPINDLY family)
MPTAGDSPRSPALLMQDAADAYSAGDWARTERLCGELLAMRADDVEALNMLGIIKARTQRSEEAAALLKRVVVARPGSAAAHNNYGNVLRDLGRHREAIACYDRAISIDPAYGEAYSNRGGALTALGRTGAALESYERALRLRPDDAETHYNRGVVLQDLRRPVEAAASYVEALKLRPDLADGYYNLGNVLHELNQHEEALRCYDRALELRQDFAQAYNNRGNALRALGRTEDALASYGRASDLEPTLVDALVNRAGTLNALGRPDQALSSYEQIRRLNLNPELPYLHGDWLQTKAQLCDWSDFDSASAALIAKVENGERAGRPSTVFAFHDDPQLQLRAARIYTDDAGLPATPPRPITASTQRPRIRLGYYSADFNNHAMAQLTAGLFEEHDRARFELVAFSFGSHPPDAMSERLRKAFDRFEDVRAHSDDEVAQMSRKLEIDIAIDLNGFTRDSRPAIFANRAAPLQVSYMGYPGTSGASFLDYLVADATVIPAEQRRHYSEKVIFLPHSYFVNDRKRLIADQGAVRGQLGLPAQGFVYCCFNSAYKLTPGLFAAWMRVLTAVDGSVLWLLYETEQSAANLRREAARLGVDQARLVFARRLPPDQHLARQRAANLFLDTHPCGAHTTACDALWAGVPVLTRLGASIAARVAASLLGAVGLPELIATSPAEYEALAIELGRNPARLAELRGRLDGNRLTTPLFDTALFARHLENGLSQIHARQRAGLPPDDIVVPASLPRAATGG